LLINGKISPISTSVFLILVWGTSNDDRDEILLKPKTLKMEEFWEMAQNFKK